VARSSPLGIVLRPYQVAAARAIVASVRERRALTLSVMMARQAGKNELSAQVELYLLARHLHRPEVLIKCAPTFDPQARISLRRLWERLEEAGLRELAALEEGRAVRLGRARQLFLSAEPGAHVVGHTATLLLEVDEAQEVGREKFQRDFLPMAAAHGATIVFYGTPWDGTTMLEEMREHHLELERRDGVRRHFQFDWTAVAEHSPAYARFVEGERQRLGEEHPLFLTQYTLRSIGGGGRLLSPGQLAQLRGGHPRQAAPRPGEVYVAGLDVGGQDLPGTTGQHDATVLTIARVHWPPPDAFVQEPRLEVVEHRAWTGEPHEALHAQLVDLLRHLWRVRRLAVDASGLGETLARLLARSLGEETVAALRFTAETKSRLGYGLLAAINGGRLKLYAPDGSAEAAALWRELELARAAYRPNRTMSFYVEAGQGHDDYLVSLALTVEAARGLQGPRTARGRLSEVRAW
jgi:hypothetical protein